MKRGAIIETACDARERYPMLLALMRGTLGTLGFVWGSVAVLPAALGQPKSCRILPPIHGEWCGRGKPSSKESTTVLLFGAGQRTFLEEDRD